MGIFWPLNKSGVGTMHSAKVHRWVQDIECTIYFKHQLTYIEYCNMILQVDLIHLRGVVEVWKASIKRNVFRLRFGFRGHAQCACNTCILARPICVNWCWVSNPSILMLGTISMHCSQRINN